MGASFRSSLLLLVGFAFVLPHGVAQASHASTPSSRSKTTDSAHGYAIIEGEAQAGRSFESALGNGLKILLEPIASGWVLRVVPSKGPRGPYDYAELATPPYSSVSPLLVSTDFSFRAQDALAWNPRHFRFAPDRASFAELSSVFEQYQRLSKQGPSAASAMHAAEAQLATMVGQMPDAEFTILDAHLVQGTGDQTQAASLVALHPNSSARQVDQPANGAATPLGRLNWLRFRIKIELPAGFHAAPSLHTERKRP